MSWLCEKCFGLFNCYVTEETDPSSTIVMRKSFDAIESRQQFKRILTERENRDSWKFEFLDRGIYRMRDGELAVDGWSFRNKRSVNLTEKFRLSNIKYWAELEWYRWGVGLVVEDGGGRSKVYLMTTLDAEAIYEHLREGAGEKSRERNKPEPRGKINYKNRATC